MRALKAKRNFKLLAVGLAGLLLAAASGSSGFEAPLVSLTQLESARSLELDFKAKQREQALCSRDWDELRAFERLHPELRESLARRRSAWDPRWGVVEAAQQVDLSKIFPVVQIVAFQGTRYLGRPGSGTLIHPSGLLLTNSHVVREGPGGCGTPVQGELATLFVVLVTEQGKEDQPPVPKFTAVLVPGAEDRNLDAALLRIDQQVEGLKDLRELIEAVAGNKLRTSPLPSGLALPHWNLWDSRVLKEESRVLAWGYPEDKPQDQLPRLELSRGPIFTFEPKYLFIDKLFTIPGISGGPVVDLSDGLIVGLICGRSIPTTKPAKEELTKALLVNEIQELLKKAPQRINRVPVADFTWSPRNPKVGDVVTFDASSSSDFDGSIVQYEWDFDDDGKPDATGKQASFTVRSLEDLQKVTLKVTDNEGSSNSQTKRVILLRTRTCVARIGEREFTSIQEAIEKAQPGDTIVISEGQCQEDLSIIGKQDLTLRGAGQGQTTLFGTGTAPVIKIQDSQGITVEGLKIRDGLVGLEVLRSTKIIIRQNAVVQNLGRGISLLDASGVRIEQNVIEANGEEGLQVRGAPLGEAVEVRANKILRNGQGGVLIRETVGMEYTLRVVLNENVIERNKLVGVAITRFAAAEISGGWIAGIQSAYPKFGGIGIGLEVDSRYQTKPISNITIFDNENGLIVRGSTTLNLTDSQVSNNFEGVVARGSTQLDLTHSRISSNAWGLKVEDLARVSLTNSQVFSSMVYGLEVGDSATVSLSNSWVSGNGLDGLFVKDSATMEIKDNVFTDHEACGIRVISRKTQIRGTSNKMGNNGADLCGFAPASLRRPLVPTTNKTHLSVPGDFDSLQEAVDAITPGGTITVAAGVYKIGLTIWKPLRLRGAGHTQTVLKASRGLVVSIIAEAQRVQLEELMITGGSWYGLLVYSQAEFRDVQVSENGLLGAFDVVGSALVEITDSVIKDNKGVFSVGLFVGDSATVNIANAQVSGNTRGLAIVDLATVNLFNSQVSSNIEYGLSVRDSAAVSVRSSIIQGNGTDSRCQQADWICNGIEEWEEAQLTLSNSIIKDNTDWGVAAVLKKCGYREDDFTGQLVFKGTNTIEGNNKSGNHKGNPGNHPWNRPGVPDGQVCLP